MNGFLKCPDYELYYEITGNGPPLIFAHGLGGNYLSWWQQIPFFEKKFTCITFSHRGFWPNAGISEIPSISVFADDLAALIDHLKIESPALVAQSFGGWTCIEYALRQPSRLRALVMASTTGTLNYSEAAHPEVHRLKEWKERTDNEKSILLAKNIIPGAGLRMASEQPSHYYLFEHINKLTPAVFRESLRSSIHRARTLSSEIFSGLKLPVLFITGEEDLLFPPAAAAIASSLLPESIWKSIHASGHSAYFERAQLFNQLVDEFL